METQNNRAGGSNPGPIVCHVAMTTTGGIILHPSGLEQEQMPTGLIPIVNTGKLRALLRDRSRRRTVDPAGMDDRTLYESIGRELVLLRTLFGHRASDWLRRLEAERERRTT